MKAVTLGRHGGPDVLAYEEIPDPTPAPGHVLVRVRATALNHLDVWTREGLPGLVLEWPHVLGADVAGEVDGARVLVNPGVSCGVCERCLSGADNLCREYRILGEHVRGGNAQLVAVPRANLVPYPAGLSFEEAAAIPLVFLTAWQMIAKKARVRPGQTVLVWAAGSGVGSAALQIAKLHGATVIATGGTSEKLARAKSLGADHAVLHGDVLAAVKEITKKRGVEVVVEHVGAATWETSIRALAWGGRLVTCGATSGPEAKTDLRHVFYRQLEILGSTMGSKADLFDVVRHVEAGRLRPVVDRVLPLEKAADAHRALEARETFGKIVLTVP